MKRIRWIVGGLGAVACLLPDVELEDSKGSGGGGGKSGSAGSATSGGTAGDGAGQTSGGSAGRGGTTGNGGSGGDGGEGGADGGGAGTPTGGDSGDAGMGGTRAGSGGRATGGAAGVAAGAGGTMAGAGGSKAGAGGSPAGAGGSMAGAGGSMAGAGGSMAGAGGTMAGAGGSMAGAGGAGSGGGGAGGTGGTMGGSGGVAGACTFPSATSAWPDSPTVFCTNGSIAGTCPSSGTAYGQDGNHVGTTNAYTLANGVVTDPLLGLEWMRPFATNPATFSNASDYCASSMFSGRTGWRLPNRLELVSITDYGRFDPVLDPAFFLAPTEDFLGFWSRTAHVGMAQNHWIVRSDDGDLIPRGNLLDTQVRCVRGTPLALSKDELAGCSVIFDSFTGLGFQKHASGYVFSWIGALAHCENLEQDGFFDWRLPSVKELLTTVDVTVVNPAVDPANFPGTPSEMFWTSTPFVNNAANAWVVDFADGSAVHDQPTSAPHRARCVRGG